MKSMRTLYEERIEKRRRDSHSYSIGSISPESSSRLQIWRDDWAQSDEVFDAKVQSGKSKYTVNCESERYDPKVYGLK